MEENIRKIVTKLKERGLSQVDICAVIVFSNNDESVINKLITKLDLKSDLLQLEITLLNKNSVKKREETNLSKMKDKQDDDISTSVHTLIYEKESDLDKLLNVTYNEPNIGDLKLLLLSFKLNYCCVMLSLAYMDLSQ